MKQHVSKLSITLVITGVCTLSGAAPIAHAALPAISCTPRNGLNWCVSFDGNSAQAGVGNPNDDPRIIENPGEFTRVELVYYDPTPRYRGERVFASDHYFISLGSGQVKHSPTFQTWLPGTYCARMYLPEVGRYQDIHCVNTDGVVVGGNAGNVPPIDVQ